MTQTIDQANMPDTPALFSREAEQSVLGGLLLDNGAIDRISDLRPEHFAFDDNRRIFTAIVGDLLAGKPADIMTVFDHLDAAGHAGSVGGLVYLNQLVQSIPSAANVKRHAALVIDRHKARQLMQAGARVAELAQDGTMPVDDRIGQAQAAVEKLTEQVAQREASPLYEAMVRHTERLERRAEGKERVFPTGLADIDRRLAGGMRPGELIVLAARPRMGKTAKALTWALTQSQQYSVGFLSQEMPESQLCDRATSQLGRIDLEHVLQPELAGDELWAKVIEATEMAASRNLYIDDQGSLTIHQVASKARKMKRKHGLDVLYVDYLQLMAGTDSRQPRAYQLEEICRGLKALAKALEIAIVALAQVNRKVDGEMPGLADLKDSGAIEQDADIVIFIHRPIADQPDLGPDWELYAKAFIAKVRQGNGGYVNLSYFGSHTRFAGWDGPEPKKQLVANRKSHNL